MKKIILLLLPFFLLPGACKKKENQSNNSGNSNKHSVIYNSNGSTSGSVPVDGNLYSDGEPAAVMDNSGNLFRTGYAFVGWNTAADGSGTDYLPGYALVMGSANITLYAKWNNAGPFYSITYYGNGNTSGTVPGDNTSYLTGALATIKSGSSLLKSGNSFQYWNTSSSGFGTSYMPGSQISMQGNLTLYAIYGTSSSSGGKYYGFNASGQLKSKSSYTSSWSSEDLSNTFGTSLLVTALWDGSKFVGFNASGQTKTKSSLTSSWSSADMTNTFGSSNVVAVVWNGSKYVGFNASGQAKTKSSLTSSWSSADLTNTFGSTSLVAVVWDGSKYVGFNSSGQVKTKSSLTSIWSSADMTNTFGSSLLVSVSWDGSKYIGYNASGQLKTKSSLTSSWSSQDLVNTFGSSNIVCSVYK